jgi:arylsulfatase A-like enzyme
MNRRTFLSGLAATGVARAQSGNRRRMNVLMIAVDDMRPELGCYGAKHIHSPNIDALARRGTVFTRAYCQQAVCSPSRTSLLTGLRPDTTKVYELQTHFRKILPDAVTLPEAFKNAGYETTGFSKIFHGGLNDTRSWTIPHWQPGGAKQPEWNTPEAREAARRFWENLEKNGLKIPPAGGRGVARGPAWESPDVADNELPDGRTADVATTALGQLKDKPFFLAVGFLKPHLPFIAPKKYFDLYPLDKVEMPDYAERPAGAPELAFHANGELRGYGNIGDDPITPQKAREAVRAYYAAMSYTDANIGRVLAALKKNGLEENTIVCLWGDHGWHLNNHGLWHKHTNFEKATNSMLVVADPRQRQKGTKSSALVEFVDIYPTLADTAGVETPKSLEGASFRRLLDDPKLRWKTAAFSQYPRSQGGKQVMGYTMRTERYRYTEWRYRDGGEVIDRELYDYEADPRESVNHARNPENAELLQRLAKQMQAGWRGALPRA